MTKEALAEMWERVSTWSEEAKDELATSIIEIESRHADNYEMTDEDRAAIDRGLADIKAGRIAEDGAVEALFNRYFK